ncbi:uncharacterized protein LOC127788585 [Diospyros lotus]|uniref:uncharacterized protein LOC127788585 n=1 Tax=Diospyros lotus TaxID=55363 RepID=UPI002258F5D5|nr:uncharacterized protein LOC127788585 [Diospyros lotus]
MASSNLVAFLLFFLSTSTHLTLGHNTMRERGGREEGRGWRRVLMAFKETPSGGNVTFECTPSGPCIACLYSEKNDAKYRCSETGYRIPLKCVETGAGSNEANGIKAKRTRSTLENSTSTRQESLPDSSFTHVDKSQRNLLDDSSTHVGGSQAYITYRSCIPAIVEEKLSILGFEGIILGLLLISSSVVYFRRKQSSPVSSIGAMRIPSNSRF